MKAVFDSIAELNAWNENLDDPIRDPDHHEDLVVVTTRRQPSEKACTSALSPLFCYNSTPVIPSVSRVSPINVDRFQLELVGHPNSGQVAFVIDCLRNSFRLLFDQEMRLKSALIN